MNEFMNYAGQGESLIIPLMDCGVDLVIWDKIKVKPRMNNV